MSFLDCLYVTRHQKECSCVNCQADTIPQYSSARWLPVRTLTQPVTNIAALSAYAITTYYLAVVLVRRRLLV